MRENKLDELAADVLLNALNFSQKVGVVVLDKHPAPYTYDSDGGPARKYAVVSDALDGYVTSRLRIVQVDPTTARPRSGLYLHRIFPPFSSMEFALCFAHSVVEAY